MSCFDNNKCNDNKKIYNDALKKIENAKKNKPIGCNCISKNNPSSLTGPTGPTGPTHTL